GHARRTLVGAVGVTEVVAPDPVPIDRGPRGVRRVPALGGRAEEAETLRPEGIHRLFDLLPGQLDVSHLAQVGVGRVARDAVVFGTDVRAGGDDRVGQVGRGLDRLTMNDQVLAVLDRLGDVGIAGQSATVGVERDRVVDLLPERHAWVGAKEHQGRPWLTAVRPGYQLIQLI